MAVLSFILIIHSYSVLICRLIKKIKVKEDPRRETDSSFDSLPSAYEVL